MSVSKLTKYINLALNNSSEGEAQTSARMFFKKLASLDMKFNPRTFNLTRAQARRLADLADKMFIGLNDAETLKAPTTEAHIRKKTNANSVKLNIRKTCYDEFGKVDMEDGKTRRTIIDRLVSECGFDKRSVQSYSSNYRAGKWR